MAEISPGGRPINTSSLDRSPKKNWVEKRGGLPPYIRGVARGIARRHGGAVTSRDIAAAINAIKRWAATSKDPKVKAAAAKALIRWEAMKAPVDLAHKFHPYDPDQPRAPKGAPAGKGGQWVKNPMHALKVGGVAKSMTAAEHADVAHKLQAAVYGASHKSYGATSAADAPAPPDWEEELLADIEAKEAAALSEAQVQASEIIFNDATGDERYHSVEDYKSAPVGILLRWKISVDQHRLFQKTANNTWRTVHLNNDGEVTDTDIYASTTDEGMKLALGKFTQWAPPQDLNIQKALAEKAKLQHYKTNALAAIKGEKPGTQIELQTNPDAPPNVYQWQNHTKAWYAYGPSYNGTAATYVSTDMMTKAVTKFFDTHDESEWGSVKTFIGHQPGKHKPQVADFPYDLDGDEYAMSQIPSPGDENFPSVSGEDIAPVPSHTLFADDGYVVDRINAYTGDWANEVNNALRSGDFYHHESEIDEFDDAFTPAKTNFTAYRTVPADAFDRWSFDEILRDREDLIGTEFEPYQNEAYMSTSLSPDFVQASPLVLKIHVPAGTPVINADNPDASPIYYVTGEREIILGRGLPFKITNIRKVKNTQGRPQTIVDVDITGPSPHYTNEKLAALDARLGDVESKKVEAMNLKRLGVLRAKLAEAEVGDVLWTVDEIGGPRTPWEKVNEWVVIELDPATGRQTGAPRMGKEAWKGGKLNVLPPDNVEWLQERTNV